MGSAFVGIIMILVLVGVVGAALYLVSTSKRPCPYCHTMMPKKVVKCPHCRKAIPLNY
jgi:hypothetical protein